jgi:hypothetical protein
MATITVLNPVGERREATMTLPALPRNLDGLTVGFLDNTKHNFDRLVEGMGAALTARLGVKRVVHVRKANASSPAGRELIEALAKDCDVVFAGSAD